jgi:glutathione reductase (NADPH)
VVNGLIGPWDRTLFRKKGFGLTYDLIVLGGGSGGVRAARIAAGYGAKVALVEEYRLGGTCVIRGCVPKKLMVYASRFAIEFEEARGYGWRLDTPTFHWETLTQNRDQEVDRLEKVYRANLEKSGVQIFEGHARLTDTQTVLVNDQEKLTGKTILIATGAEPVTDSSIEGHELCIDSNDFFKLQTQPKRVVVQGSGYIALELACVLHHLGSEVHLVYRSELVLRGFDQELRHQLNDELRLSGMNLHARQVITKITKHDQGLQVSLENGVCLEADCVLKAIGRRPNTRDLGLEQLGIKRDDQGAISVNEWSQTNLPNIYAVGDVTNRVNLTPMAIREGHAFADNVFGGKAITVNHSLVPTAVFTTPELGTVGLTEEEALARYPRLDVYKSSFRPLKATVSGHASRTFFKLLVNRDNDEIVGFHSIGPDTGEMSQLIGIALQMKATKTAFDATLAVHPTAAEELVTMRSPSIRHGLND